MSRPPCGRCGDGTRARHHVTGTGGGPPVNENVCDAHLDDARDAASRHPYRSAELIPDDGQDALFDLGGRP